MTQTETRSINLAQAELRATVADDGKRRLAGVAVPYNTRSLPLGFFFGEFRETFAPGAFAKHLAASPDVHAFSQHDSDKVLGRTKAGTLRLSDSDAGLRFEIDLPDTSYARDLYESVQRGDITGMSFGFRVVTDEWNVEDKMELRTVKEAELIEVSPVTYPAYPDTDVATRSYKGRYAVKQHRNKLLKWLIARDAE